MIQVPYSGCMLCNQNDGHLMTFSHVFERFIHLDCLDEKIANEERSPDVYSLAVEFSRVNQYLKGKKVGV